MLLRVPHVRRELRRGRLRLRADGTCAVPSPGETVREGRRRPSGRWLRAYLEIYSTKDPFRRVCLLEFMVVDCLVVVSFVVRGASSSVTLGLTTVIPDCRKNLCYPKRDSVVVSYWAKLQILITLNSGPRVETLSLQPFAPPC